MKLTDRVRLLIAEMRMDARQWNMTFILTDIIERYSQQNNVEELSDDVLCREAIDNSKLPKIFLEEYLGSKIFRDYIQIRISEYRRDKQ